MRWKAWIMVVAVLVAGGLLGDWICFHVLILGSPAYDTNRLIHLYHPPDGEIPIFGTSKARGHYDPAEMGIKAYNYGMNSSSYEVTDVLLNIELARQSTTPIMIELEYEDPNSLGDIAKFIPMVADPQMSELLKRFHAMSWRYDVPGIRFFGWYSAYLRVYLNRGLEKMSITNGYTYNWKEPRYNRQELQGFVDRRLQARTGYFPNEDQERRLIGHITAHPERLFILLYSPYHSAYFTHFQNADKLKLFQDKLCAYSNVVLIDWSHREYPDEVYLDTIHMRHEGAVDYSRKIGDKIREVLRERNIANAK